MYYNIESKYNGVCNVQMNFNIYFDMLTNKVCNLFIWKNLPETVDERSLNLNLMLKGKVCFTEFNGKLYALDGNIGGEPNCYHEPQEFIISNPILGSKQVKIRQRDGSDSIKGLTGILMANSDVDYMSDRGGKGGLYGLIYQTAGLLADNISSLNISQINGRVSQVFTADDEAMARTQELVLKDIYEGKPYKIVTQDIIDKIGALPTASTGQANTLLNLIEAHQYILAQFFNEIGIGANWNMKRERVNTAETELMTDSLDINIWNMLENRQKAVEKINELFGTNISVELNQEIYKEEEEEEAPIGEEVREEVPKEEETLAEVKEDSTKKEEEEKEEDKKEGDSNDT